MSNGAGCCAAGVCCPPLSEKSINAMTVLLVNKTGCEEAEVRKMVVAIKDEFDVWPKGHGLGDMIDYARHHKADL